MPETWGAAWLSRVNASRLLAETTERSCPLLEACAYYSQAFFQRGQSAPAPCWTLVFTTPRLFAEKTERSCPLLDSCVYYTQAFISFFLFFLIFCSLAE